MGPTTDRTAGPGADAPAHPRPGGWPAGGPGLAVLAFVLTSGLHGARLLVSGWPFDRLWAEDGAVFLADAVDSGWGSVVWSYAGYMHGLPRVLTLLGSQLPLVDFARFAVLAALVVSGLVGVWVLHSARAVTGSRGWALLAAVTTVAVPALRVESLGSLANLQWFLLYGALWACLREPLRGRGWWATAAGALVVAVTTPLAVALAPVLLLHRRGALRHPATAGIASGLVLQALSRLFAPQTAGRVLDRAPGVPDGLARSYLDSVAGVPVTPAATAAAFGVLLLLAGAAALAGAHGHRLAVAVVALVGAALYAGTSVITDALTGRYAGLGALFLWAALVLAASAVRNWAAPAVASLLVAAAVIGFPADPYLLSGPSWSAEVQQATDRCAGPGAPQRVALELSPAGWGTVTLPCATLR
ncbi:hypothetical protein ACI8AH_21155 [Modestobacter sp. SYSU DS0903]